MLGSTYQETQIFSSTIFDEHNNKSGKGWSPGSALMTGTNISAPSTLKTDLSDHPFITYYISEAMVTFTPTSTTIGIVEQLCEHQNILYVSQ